MFYSCNMCNQTLGIEPDHKKNKLECKTCGMKYYAATVEGSTSKAGNGSAVKETAEQVPDLSGPPVCKV